MRVSREAASIIAVVVLCASVVFFLVVTPEQFQYGDNCGYMAVAWAIAQGQGFTDPSISAHTNLLWWPPGFPLVLALLYVVTFGNFTAATMILLVCFFAAVVFWGKQLYRETNNLPLVLGVVAAISLSSALHQISSYLYSETWCVTLVLTITALWYRWRTRWSWSRLIVFGLLATYCAMVRNICMVIPITAIGALLYHALFRKEKIPNWAWLAVAVPFAGYVLWVTAIQHNGIGSITTFFAPQAGLATASAHIIAENYGIGLRLVHLAMQCLHSAGGYVTTLIPQSLFFSAYYPIPMNSVKLVLACCITGLVIIGWIASCKKFLFINIIFVLYMAVLLLYGAYYTRLLVPVVPFLMFYFLNSVWWIVKYFRGKKVAYIAVALASCALVFDNGYWSITKPRYYMQPHFGGNQYQECLAYVKKSIEPMQTIMSEIPWYLFYVRGAYCIPFPPRNFTLNEVITYCEVNKVQHILIQKDTPLLHNVQSLIEHIEFSSQDGSVVCVKLKQLP